MRTPAPLAPPPAPVVTAAPPPPTTAAPVPTTAPTPALVKGIDYAFLGESTTAGLYTRWDPCKDPITYQIDTTVAPTPDEDAAILAAVAAASTASGHTFQLVG